jgi:hypothetical protein
MDPETIPGRPRRLGRQRSDGGGCDPGTLGPKGWEQQELRQNWGG